MRIYFFPGLGADSSLAKFHQLPGYQIEWIQWPKTVQDNWSDFERDLLKENTIEPDSVFVGISFGGMVAQRITKFKKPSCIILVGSLTRSSSISPFLQVFRPWIPVAPPCLFNSHLMPKVLAAWLFGIQKQEDLSLLFEMAGCIRPADFKSLIRLALGFKGENIDACPIYTVHGERDRIIWAKSEKRDKMIPEGGHLLSVTHSSKVNETIIKWIMKTGNGMKPNA